MQGEEKIAETVPDTVAIEVTHKVHQDGRLALEFEAGRTETYGAQKRMVLERGAVHRVRRRRRRGHERARPDRVVYHTDTENAEISGSVRVRSESEKAGVSAPALAWENKPKRLTAPPEAVVRITKDDGSSITGRGFTGDFRSRQVSFSGPVEGSYVWTGDENDEASRTAHPGARATVLALAALLLLPLPLRADTFSYSGDAMSTTLAAGSEHAVLRGNARVETEDMRITAAEIELFGKDFIYALCRGSVHVVDAGGGSSSPPTSCSTTAGTRSPGSRAAP